MSKNILAQFNIRPFGGPGYIKRIEKGCNNPCAICGKEVKEEGKAVLHYGHVIGGGDEWGDGTETHDGGDCGLHPIGPDCFRQHKIKGTEKEVTI